VASLALGRREALPVLQRLNRSVIAMEAHEEIPR
jgi:hypothetical protein